MFTQKVNYYIVYALVILFVLVANSEQHFHIITASLYAALVCVIVYIIGWLTLDGAKAAWILGWVIFGLGRLPCAVVLAVFFVTSGIISKDPSASSDGSILTIRRNDRQVWANGFWFAAFVMIWFATKQEVWLYAGIASIAVATADTWATEIGEHRLHGKTYLIKGLKKTEPGTDGGISVAGTLAALSGSVLIAATAYYVIDDVGTSEGIIVALAGFFGSFADSLLGAYKQGEHIEISLFFNKNIFECDIDNDFVNWASTGMGSLFFLILSLIVK